MSESESDRTFHTVKLTLFDLTPAGPQPAAIVQVTGPADEVERILNTVIAQHGDGRTWWSE